MKLFRLLIDAFSEWSVFWMDFLFEDLITVKGIIYYQTIMDDKETTLKFKAKIRETWESHSCPPQRESDGRKQCYWQVPPLWCPFSQKFGRLKMNICAGTILLLCSGLTLHILRDCLNTWKNKQKTVKDVKQWTQTQVPQHPELKSMFPYIPIIVVDQIIGFVVKCLKEAGEVFKCPSETLWILQILQKQNICSRNDRKLWKWEKNSPHFL